MNFGQQNPMQQFGQFGQQNYGNFDFTKQMNMNPYQSMDVGQSNYLNQYFNNQMNFDPNQSSSMGGMTGKDVLGAGMGLFGAYQGHQGMKNQKKQLGMAQSELDMNWDKWNERLRKDRAIVAQNKAL